MSKQRQARAASALVAPVRAPFDQRGAEVGAVNGAGLRFGSAVLGRRPIQAVEVQGVHPVVAEHADGGPSPRACAGTAAYRVFADAA